MKIIAGIGLLCFVYGFIQVIVGWKHRNKTQNTLRLTAIVIGGGICIAALLRQGNYCETACGVADENTRIG